MPTCPNCGVEIPKDSVRYGSSIVHSMLDEMGGPEKFGRSIAQDWEKLEGHSRVLMTGKAIQLIEAEDKAKARQQEMEYIGQQQERAILLEHNVYMMESEDAYLMKSLEIGLKRHGSDFLRRVSEMAQRLLPESEIRLLEVE